MVFGGTWITQNKVLPGAYINAVSRGAVSQQLSDRGIVAFAARAHWGAEHEVIEVTPTDFQNKCMEIFGYSATADEMTGMRDLFKNAKKLYFYRLNGGTGGTKAEVKFSISEETEVMVATAKYSGTRGNVISIGIELNANTPDEPTTENPTLYDVTTYLDGIAASVQESVSNASALIDNAFVIWNKTIVLSEMVAVATGGTDAPTTGADLEAALRAFETYQFHIFSTDSILTASTGDFVLSWVKRMREDNGSKFQAVIYAPIDSAFSVDYEGIIAIQNDAIVDATTQLTEQGFGKSALVYWVAGAEAACAVNRSLSNAVYNGSFLPFLDYDKTDFENFIKKGRLAIYRNGDSVNVLSDITGYVTFTESKNYLFSKNQVVRVLDQVAIETALLFGSRYMGKVQNNANGRDSFKVAVADICDQLQDLEAIENFSIDNIDVYEGVDINSIVTSIAIEPVGAMEKLYATIYVE